MFLTDMFKAMEVTAFAFDMDQGGASMNFDLTGDQVAALLRSYVRQGRAILMSAPFANQAMARQRDDGGA